MSALTVVLSPVGPDLLRVVDRARADEKSPTVKARIGGLLFQLPAATLRRSSAELRAADASGLVNGPYCAGCRRATSTVSLTEWSTSDRRDEPLPATCPSCGVGLAVGGADSEELRRLVLGAFLAHVS